MLCSLSKDAWREGEREGGASERARGRSVRLHGEREVREKESETDTNDLANQRTHRASELWFCFSNVFDFLFFHFLKNLFFPSFIVSFFELYVTFPFVFCFTFHFWSRVYFSTFLPDGPDAIPPLRRTPFCRTLLRWTLIRQPLSLPRTPLGPPKFRACFLTLLTLFLCVFFFQFPRSFVELRFSLRDVIMANVCTRCPENSKFVCCGDIFNDGIAQRELQFHERPRNLEKNKKRVGR